MFNKTLELIGRIISPAEQALESPKIYFATVLTAGITLAFLIICTLGTTLLLFKLILL